MNLRFPDDPAKDMPVHVEPVKNFLGQGLAAVFDEVIGFCGDPLVADHLYNVCDGSGGAGLLRQEFASPLTEETEIYQGACFFRMPQESELAEAFEAKGSFSRLHNHKGVMRWKVGSFLVDGNPMDGLIHGRVHHPVSDQLGRYGVGSEEQVVEVPGVTTQIPFSHRANVSKLVLEGRIDFVNVEKPGLVLLTSKVIKDQAGHGVGCR